MDKIREILKEQLEYKNMKQRDLAVVSDVSNQFLSDYLSGKKDSISYTTMIKLENGLRLPQFSLVEVYQRTLDINEMLTDVRLKDIVGFLRKQKKYELYSKSALYNEANKVLGTTTIDKKTNELKSFVRGYKMFKNKPLAYFWVSLLERKYASNISNGAFKKSSGNTVIKGVLDILINEKDFSKKENDLKVFLDKHGIILVNAPFIPDSSIRGCTYKRNNQRFIFMSDMGKREAFYITSLVHELLHFYNHNDNEKVVDNEAVNIIENYLKKYNKSFKEVTLAFETFRNKKPDDEKWGEFRNNTKRKINFGDYKTLLG